MALLSGMSLGNHCGPQIILPFYEYEAIRRADMLQIPTGFYGEYWPDGDWQDSVWFKKFLGRAKVVIGPEWSLLSPSLMDLVRRCYPKTEFARAGSPNGVAEMLALSLFGY